MELGGCIRKSPDRRLNAGRFSFWMDSDGQPVGGTLCSAMDGRHSTMKQKRKRKKPARTPEAVANAPRQKISKAKVNVARKTAATRTTRKNVNKSTREDAQLKLQEMSLAKRIAAVAADVDSKRDEYRSIDSHELATLLGIGDADQPGGDWDSVWYIPCVAIEDIFVMRDKEDIFELLQPHVTTKRYEELDKAYDEVKLKRLISDLLTESEKQTIERGYMEKQDQAFDSLCSAYYVIKAPHGKKLTFEAYIEDDGGCIDLMTPYDERDGKFADLSDCLIVEDRRR